MNNILSKLIFTVLAVLMTAEVMAQVPQGFNFQAVARDANGDLLVEQQLGVQVTILQSAEDGAAVYAEKQTPTTNVSGSFQIVIGEGTSEDDFNGINWSSDNYYVKLEIDPAGEEEYEELGTTRLLSVPYALLAQDVVNGGGGSGTEVSLPLELTSSSGNMSITLGTNEGDNDYGFIGLGNRDGDALARMQVVNVGDTASFGQLRLDDPSGWYTTLNSGQMNLGNTEGGIYSRLISSNLYFLNSDFQTPSPLGWFGTYQGAGFTQLVDYNEAGTAEGAILTGFWPGQPSILLEDGDETPLVKLEGQYREDANIGTLTLRGTDGSEFSIDSRGISENNGPTTEILVENENNDIVASINSHESDRKKGFIHLYGETAPETDDLRAGLEVSDNGSGSSWGNLFLRGPAGDRHFVEASVSNDSDGSDPDGWSGKFDLWGTNSPNVMMGGNNWESSDLPNITLYGNKPDEDNWYYGHINLNVGLDGDNQWGQISLDANSGVPNFNFGAPGWENAELADMQLFGNTPNPDGGYYSNIDLSVNEDEDGQQWGAMTFKEGEDYINIQIGAKHWEDPIDGAGRPYMLFKGNSPDDDLIWIDVAEDGAEETGQIQLNSTDGAHFSINAHGINGDANINGNLNVEGDITHTGEITQTSDRKLKENIQQLQNGLSTILKLNPTTYNFRGNGEYKGLKLSTGLHYGLIAQEVEEVLPSLVKNNLHTYSEISNSPSGPDATFETESVKTMEYKTLNYTELVPVLVKAVQEQQQEIDELREEVDQLKEEHEVIKQLQKEVEELKRNK